MLTLKRSRVEELAMQLGSFLWAERVPFFSAVIGGLAAHGFAFTNKLLNADEISALFGKGETVISGRWGLGLTSWIFPDLSMPWVYGLLSILMLAAAVCLIMRIFRIQSPLLQGLLAVLIVSFPAQVSVFGFMFTSPSYALAFLLAVLTVWLTEKDETRCFLAAAPLAILSLGIYQAYISFMAGFFVLRMIQMLLWETEDTKNVFLYGLKRLAFLATALIVYYGVAVLALKLAGGEFVGYAVERDKGLLFRAALAYSALLRTITRGYFAFVNSDFSMLLHVVGGLLCALLLLRWCLRHREPARIGLLLLCLALLPLAINCIYLIASVDVIYSPVLYGFVCVYLLSAILMELDTEAPTLWIRDLLLIGLALITAGNVFFANKAYLKMHIDYENAYALYSGIAAQIRQTPGFDDDCTVALVGQTEQGLFHDERLDVGELGGVNKDLVNTYMKTLFLQRYIGFDVPYADRDTAWLLSLDPRVKEMPSYPYYGSVQRIDDYIVVKLGDN